MTAISRDYPHSLPDTDVLTIALREERILIVADRDFRELIFYQRRKHAGVIFFRLPGAGLNVKIERLNAKLSSSDRKGPEKPALSVSIWKRAKSLAAPAP